MQPKTYIYNVLINATPFSQKWTFTSSCRIIVFNFAGDLSMSHYNIPYTFTNNHGNHDPIV